MLVDRCRRAASCAAASRKGQMRRPPRLDQSRDRAARTSRGQSRRPHRVTSLWPARSEPGRHAGAESWVQVRFSGTAPVPGTPSWRRTAARRCRCRPNSTKSRSLTPQRTDWRRLRGRSCRRAGNSLRSFSSTMACLHAAGERSRIQTSVGEEIRCSPANSASATHCNDWLICR
jgi:hypothetical protein